METIAIVVAAGRGLRAGGVVPKQYQMSNGSPMLSLTIKALLESTKIDGIMVVINPLDEELYLDSTKNIDNTRLLKYCFGGAERSGSVEKGLKECKQYNPKNVLIHDAARPFLSTVLINRIIESLKFNEAVFPVLPIVDALWEKTGKHQSMLNAGVKPGPNRDKFLMAQTPQGFNYLTICLAYSKLKKSVLDDITVAYEFGIDISTVSGEVNNIKITSEQDIKQFKGIT